MTDQELVNVTIDDYARLQRIKKANGNTENEVLEYELRIAVAKLSSMGINVKDLTIV